MGMTIDYQFQAPCASRDFLYIPQLEGLKWFASRMLQGGVILMHDYFNNDLSGTKKAIDDFENKGKFSIVPIGDLRSIALIKK